MPELAEVEYIRKRWNAGFGDRVTRVALHSGKRIFRRCNEVALASLLTGARLVSSEARAKQMVFRFARPRERTPSLWLGIHLGMTGNLRVGPASFEPGRHDHLVLYQRTRALVFHDPRMFGAVLFADTADAPDWWSKLPPPVTSDAFTLDLVQAFFKRRARLAVKAALLVQERFPGVGNWMADEILWRARLSPERLCGKLTRAQIEAVWRETRAVCQIALDTVGVDFSDPPKDWLFHERWSDSGKCPRCTRQLRTATIGGRTTRWCPACQR
jgi:formamidopyrimidine-DNA glycosylase